MNTEAYLAENIILEKIIVENGGHPMGTDYQDQETLNQLFREILTMILSSKKICTEYESKKYIDNLIKNRGKACKLAEKISNEWAEKNKHPAEISTIKKCLEKCFQDHPEESKVLHRLLIEKEETTEKLLATFKL